MITEELKYPIGKFARPSQVSDNMRSEFINTIDALPARLRKEVNDLTDEQLDTPYRDGGWTIRQVVNHYADSHMNSLTRFKLALTEDKPTIKAYYEERWAELADSRMMPIEPALKMIEGIHQRWTVLLKSLSGEQFKRSFIHPEQGREVRLDESLALYAWHCNHHIAHIISLKKRKGWD